MDKQFDTSFEVIADQVALRDLLDSEIVLIGGGEVVICGI